MKYNVVFSVSFEIEAEDEDKATDMAFAEFVELCGECETNMANDFAFYIEEK
tara:strand:- start:7081 stop:7236 length:156 start_codon:yes stop_codon:yes gene_type:complete